MALKDSWKDKVDNVDDIIAEDINSIAHAVMENKEAIDGIQTPYIGENGNWFIYDNITKEYIDSGKPSRGEEYELTNEDKYLIVDAVLDALPNGDEVSY